MNKKTKILHIIDYDNGDGFFVEISIEGNAKISVERVFRANPKSKETKR